jgi:hypothetical protein
MNKLEDFKSLTQHQDKLVVGQTYYYQKVTWKSGFNEYEEEFVPVKIVAISRRGEYGHRVIGDDGIARYAQGWELGKNRADASKGTDLKYSLLPGKTFYAKPKLTPHVQLDLFESLVNP